MTLRPPGGTPPPATASIGGHSFDLITIAQRVSERHYRAFPDELERHGDAGIAWCRHDNQWLLAWAVDDHLGVTDLCQQACWLARVLVARDYPLDRLAHDLRIAADIVGEGVLGDASEAIAGRLAVAARELLAE